MLPEFSTFDNGRIHGWCWRSPLVRMAPEIREACEVAGVNWTDLMPFIREQHKKHPAWNAATLVWAALQQATCT